MRIEFSYDGVSYAVLRATDDAFYYIRLPDGRVLEVAWLETSPPQVGDLQVVSEEGVIQGPVFDATLA
ncbi:MAG TPA: hypothetical protein VFT87_05070 [Candidatus Saccharimonadales bacterium]|nr:hypothetical protein [Candidatus Saccharimonadales bacterium]